MIRSNLSGVGVQNAGTGDFYVGGSISIGDLGSNRCLNDLRVTDPRDDKSRIEKTKGGLLRGAYDWILTHQDFRRWRDDEEAKFLWIKGDPGKGKTMLLCGIIDQLRLVTKLADPKADKTLSYFFCQANDTRINSATAVLRGLIYMLVVQQPSLLSHIRDDYDHAGRNLFEDANAWYALSRIFTNMLQDESLVDAYLAIDGLDECITNLPELLDLIVQNSWSSHVKWIVSSRNWRQIEEYLNTTKQNVLLSLELNATSVSAAVDAYIDHKVEHLARVKVYDDPTKQIVRDHLQSNSNNTFLWVALVCQELANPRVTRRSTTERLRTFPQGLNPFYTRMMEQINESDDAELCRRVIAIVSIVERPITLAELTSLDKSLYEFSDSLEVVQDVIENCGSFIIIQDELIYHIHHSAKDFFLEKPVNQIFPGGIVEEHHLIFWRSMEVMFKTLHRNVFGLQGVGCLIEQVQAPALNPLASAHYSCTYWVEHLCHTGELQDETSAQLARFFNEKFLYWLETLSLLRSIPGGTLSLRRLYSFVQKNASGVLIKLVYDAYRFIIQNSWVIEQAPLQAYGSALLFSPSNSLIRRRFKQEEPGWVALSYTAEEWDACLLNLQSVDWLRYLPGGKTIITSSGGGNISIQDSDTGACLQTRFLESYAAHGVALSPSGTHLAAYRGASYKVWDLSTGSCIEGPTDTAHECSVECIAFSSDGSRLVLASSDVTVTTWDISNGACLHSFPCLTGYSDISDISSPVCLSADGSRMASIPFRSENSWIVWDTSSGRVLQRINDYSREFKALVLSPNGNILVTQCSENSFTVWHTTSETLLWNAQAETVISFSYDGSLLLTRSENVIEVWNIHSGVRERLVEHDFTFTWCILSPDNRRLAVGTRIQNAKIWDISSDIRLNTNSRYQIHASCIDLSSDENLLVSGDKRTVKIWEAGSGECLHSLGGHEDDIECVSFAPDGLHLASKSVDGAIKIWSPEEGVCLHTLKHTHLSSGSVAFSRGGDYLAASDGDFIKIWNVRSGERVQILDGFHGFSSPQAFSPGSDLLVSTNGDSFTKSEVLKIWNASSGAWLQTLDSHADHVNCVAFAPNNRSLASGSEDGTIKLWDIDHGICMKAFDYHKSIWSVAMSPDNSFVSSASHDHSIQLWDIKSGTCRNFQDDQPVWSLNFSPDGKLLASGTYHHSIKLWSVQSGTCLQTFDGRSLDGAKFDYGGYGSWDSSGASINDSVCSVMFSGNGSWFASSSDNGTTCIWDIEKGKCRAILGDVGNTVKSVALSPNDQYIAVASDESVKVWDIKSETCLSTLETSVWGCVAFSPNSKRLKLASYTGIEVWDINAGEYLDNVRGHYSYDEPVAFFCDSPDYTSADSSTKNSKIWTGERGTDVHPVGHQHIVHGASLNPQDATLSSKYAIESLLRSLGVESESQTPNDISSSGLGLSEKFDWITWNGRNVLWLPPDYEAEFVAIKSKTIAIISKMGKVVTFRFSDMELFHG